MTADLKRAIEQNVIVYKDTANLNDFIDFVNNEAKMPIGDQYNQIQNFQVSSYRQFSENDTAEYVKDKCCYPPTIKNPDMYFLFGNNGQILLGCKEKEIL